MPTVEAYADRVTPVAPVTPVVDLLARLESTPDLQLLPVLDGDRLVGLIERSALLMRLAASPAARLTADQLMDAEPVVVEADADIEALCDIILSGGDAAVARGFVVTRRGVYLGVGSASGLLRALRKSSTDSQTPSRTPDVDASSDGVRLAEQVHDAFSSPILGLTAAVEVLERQIEAGPVLEQIRAIGDQARDIAHRMADLAEFRCDAPALVVAPTLLRGLLDEVEACWSPRTARNGVTLLIGYEGDTELCADLDGPRLRRLLDNLIYPAVRYAREGMVELRFKAQAIGGEVHISAQVRDDEPRERTGGQTLGRSIAREGFDLSAARRLAVRLGGRLRAENNAGRGSTLTLELEAPLSIAAESPASNIETLVDLDLQAAPHILIVDDNATNRVVAQALVEMFGCSCETAEDGVQALEAVQSRPFDLILMDIKMPRMDGVEATRAIRALNGPERLIPIIALTANADPADAAAYVASGMVAVVEKPIRPERLRMAMNAALTAEAEDDQAEGTSGRLRA